MTKSTLHKKKVIPLAVVLTLFILGIFNLNSVSAISWPGDGALFVPDDDHPTQYGVYIPQPNTYSAISVDASNQGEYAMMNWLGGTIDNELVDYPGEDISALYPWYFDTYFKDSTTNNNFTNPWAINWINVTTMNPYDIQLSNYTVNSIFNYHVMPENSMLNLPLNSSIPMQIDLMIDSVGPKMLKLNLLNGTNPDFFPTYGNINLISPSGRLVDGIYSPALYQDPLGFLTDRHLFDYLGFVANEKGAYRLLMQVSVTIPTMVSLEFLDCQLSNLPLNELEFGGNVDGPPTLVNVLETEWQNQWYKFNGKAGEVYRLDIGIDYEDLASFPFIGIWMPCENGYVLNGSLSADVYDIYFPTTGTAYFSFIDGMYGDAYSYSLYLEESAILNYTIGYEPFITRLSRDQRKAIEFEVEQDSFVRFNYTFFDQPEGDPIIYAEGTNYGFIFEDAKKLQCYEIISSIDTKVVGDETYYYYYMPAGTYKALLKNNDVRYEGIVQISSKYVDYLNDTIPITSLTYPDIYPSQFLTIGFDPDEYYNGIYQAQCVDIEITEPGQYILNATIYASDNLAGIPTEADPLKVITYNSSADTYLDVTELALDPSKNFSAFSTDNPSATLGDRVYIAYNSKWHDMHFNFSQFGIGGTDLDAYYWNGANWVLDFITSDNPVSGTQDFNQNGTIFLDDFATSVYGWNLGASFDLPDIDEDQYYWLGIEHDTVDGSPYTQLPYIQSIKLSNITLEGDINLALVGESGYEYCDFWEPYITSSFSSLLINQEVGNENDSASTWLFQTSDPNVPYLEAGIYKLLVIPHGWGYQGTLQIDFGISNLWSYRQQVSYNITEEPNLYPYQINYYNKTWYGPDNVTIFSYGLTTSAMNYTQMSYHPDFSGQGYFVVECFGEPYLWTQLVIAAENVTNYDLYILQDLPWINNNGPNGELQQLLIGALNTTIEFGALTDHFYLIFEYLGTGNNITQFMLDLTQYNTAILTTSIPIGSYSPPSPGLSGPLVLGLAIGIPVAAGIIVVIYVLKKKGRIFSKTP